MAIFRLLLAVGSVQTLMGAERQVSVTYAFAAPSVETVGDATRLTVNACQLFQRVGQPEVPFRTGKILLPAGARVEKVGFEPLLAVETLTVARPLAFGRTPVPIGMKDHPAVARAALDKPDPVTYGGDAAYPASRVELVSVQKMNGYSVAIVRIFPVQYLPASGKVLFSPQLKVTVTLDDGGGQIKGESMRRSGEPQAGRVTAFVDNPEETASYEAPAVLGTQPLTTYDYLLVTRAALTNAFQPLVAQKVADGLSVKVATVESVLADYAGVDDAAKLRTFITYAYTNWNTTYVLLGGDLATVPYRQAYADCQGVDATMPCDLYFACLDGTWNADGDSNWGEPTDGEGGGDVDLLAEVYVGRAPVDTVAEVANFMGKTLYYEQNGHANADSVRLLGEYLGNYSGVDAQGGDGLDGLLPSFSAFDVRWLDDRPTAGETWNGWDCVDALNESPHLVAHDGHANETYALRMEESYIDDLVNTEPFLVNSMGCYCGAFDYADCFAEELVKRHAYGAFSVIMNSRYGWFNTYEEGMFSGEFMGCFFDELLVQGNRNIGVANQLAKHDMIGSVETNGDMCYRWCYFEITLFGDPHTMLAAGDGMKVFPADEFAPFGYAGGPFTPQGEEYTVSNWGTNTLTWALSHSANWISLSSSGGMLGEGGASPVSLTMNANANVLPPGRYTDTLVFSNTVSGYIRSRAVALTVRGDVAFTADAYTVTEAGGVQALMSVFRGGNTNLAVTVDFATTDGTATAGSDYVATNGTLVFAPQEIHKSFSVPILDDAVTEGAETVTLTLSNPTGGGTVGEPGTAILTITDDDMPIEDELTTTFEGGIWSYGNMFDIVPQHNLGITALDVNCYSSMGQTTRVTVFYREGSSFGHESVSNDWSLLGIRTVTSAGPNMPTPVDLSGCGVTFMQGHTYGLYVHCDSGLIYTSGSNTYENAAVRLITNCGNAEPPFVGGSIPQRIWNGSVYYTRENLDHLSVFPENGLSALGYQGGPFSPWYKVYMLTNAGTSSVTWTGTAGQNWVTTSPSGGTLAGGAAINVTVSIDADANVLTPGMYQDALIVSNTASGYAQSRAVTLRVLAIPGEIGVTDSIEPVTDLRMPFGPVIVGLSRTEQITVTNSDPEHDIIIGGLSVRSIGGVRVLVFAAGEDPAVLRAGLAAFPDIAAVDFLDGAENVPTGEELAEYDVVIVMGNYEWLDTEQTGNVLADYIDGGGCVIEAVASFATGGEWELNGRFVTDGYGPFVHGEPNFFDLNLGEYDTAHPIMQGVTTLEDSLTASVTLADGAKWVADWDDGSPLVAVQGSGVVGINIFPFDSGYYSGDVVLLFHNAVVYLNSIASFAVGEIPPMPYSLQPGSNLTFGVTYLPKMTGAGTAALVIESNDKDEPAVAVALSGDGIPDYLSVSPDMGLSGSGHPGGPFAPESQMYSVSNNCAVAISWTAGSHPAWVTVTPDAGTLPVGASAQVTVSFNAAAAALPEGVYDGDLLFSNVTTTVTQTRPLALEVFTTPVVRVAPPVITVTNRMGQARDALLQIGNAAWADASLDFTLSASETSRNPVPLSGRIPVVRDFTTLPKDAEYRAGELLVRFGEGAAGAARAQTLAAAGGGIVIREYTLVPGLTVIRLPEGTALADALVRFNQTAGILYAQPNYLHHAIRVPDDPYFSYLWGMNNAGQTGGTADADIDAPEAWESGVGGAAVTVAVIDSGVDYAHEDLAQNMWRNPGEIPGNGIDDDENGYVDDVHGYDFCNGDSDPKDDNDHGTHCSGTIGAVGDNGVGVAGVCWSVRIMAMKFLDSTGSGSTADALSCIEYAVLMGARVLSNSWGGGGYEQALKDAIDAAGAADVLFIAAAGNDYGIDNDVVPSYPASYESDNVISVMSVDDEGAMSSFSNYGLESVDIAAPGSSILSCKRGGGYQYMSGTSMATPHVSGACALLLSLDSSLTCQQVKHALLSTTDASLPGLCVSGGLMKLANAVTYTPAWLRLRPVTGGNVAPGAWSNITVTADAGTLLAGTYEGMIRVGCNDRFTPVTNVPVTMVILQDSLNVRPAGGFVSSGYTGGPFTPSDSVYALTNAGTSSLTWTATGSQPWVTVSPAGGVLAAGQGVQVAVAPNAQAGLLPPGAFAGGVVFSNLTSMAIQHRSVDLTVMERVFERLVWDAIAPLQRVGQPFGVTLRAVDQSGQAFAGYTNRVTLTGLGRQSSTNIAFHADFESGLAGFSVVTIEGTQLWHRTTGRALDNGHTANYSLYYGQNEGASGGGDYDAGWSEGVIVSPVIDLSAAVAPISLSFNYLLETEVFQGFDGATVEVWREGESVTSIVASNMTGGEVLVDPTTGWMPVQVDLSMFVGSQIRLGFRFNTMDEFENDYEGWYVDDVTILTGGLFASVPIDPVITDHFVSGVWTGSVAVLVPSSNMLIRAHDGAGNGADSNPFEVAVRLIDLPEALDNDAVSWSTGGAAGWSGQSVVTCDGEDAAQSGAVGDRETSWLETQVTGPCNASFRWSVSSEDGWDWLEFYVDGILVDRITGETAWRQKTVVLTAGAHTLKWFYVKDGDDIDPVGQDCGWVDEFVIASQVVGLSEALDHDALTWTTGGTSDWAGQTAVAHDGIDAARSGGVGNRQSSWLETQAVGPGTVTFWWRVSSEDGWDWLELYVDGVLADRITGDTGWQQKSLLLASGTHALKWRYVKDAVDIEPVGQDCGWVDQFTGPTASVLPSGWLSQYGLPTDGSADYMDADGDGMSNWEEWVAGTVPTNGLSLLQLQAVLPEGGTGDFRVRWQSVPGKLYWVGSCDDLTYPVFFTPFVSNVLGVAGSTEVLDTRSSAGGARFYRVGVQQ